MDERAKSARLAETAHRLSEQLMQDAMAKDQAKSSDVFAVRTRARPHACTHARTRSRRRTVPAPFCAPPSSSL